MLSETVSIPHVGRNVMYAYFALGEVPYLRVLRQNGAYAISAVPSENVANVASVANSSSQYPIGNIGIGSGNISTLATFPSEGSLAPCGNWGQSPSETVEFSEIDADSGKMASFLAGVVKESGTYVILLSAVPKHILKTFTRPFADIAGSDSPPLWDHVLTGNIEEPRSLMRNFIAQNGLPHWWPSAKSAEPPQPASDVSSLSQSSGGSTAPNLPMLTKKVGTGRMAVAVFWSEERGFDVDMGLWSPAQGRVLNSEEEVSAWKCRFSTANPSATVFQKRIFAEVAQDNAVFRHLNWGQPLENWGQPSLASNPACQSLFGEIANFAQNHGAIVILSGAVPKVIASEMVARYGEGRVFGPPYIGLRSAMGGNRS